VVELSSGRIALAPQLPGWEGLPLGSRLAGPSGGRPSPPGHGPAARLRRAWSWARGASLVTVSVRFPGRASLSPLRRPHRSRLSGSPKSASVNVQGLLSFRCDPREPMGAVSALLRVLRRAPALPACPDEDRVKRAVRSLAVCAAAAGHRGRCAVRSWQGRAGS